MTSKRLWKPALFLIVCTAIAAMLHHRSNEDLVDELNRDIKGTYYERLDEVANQGGPRYEPLYLALISETWNERLILGETDTVIKTLQVYPTKYKLRTIDIAQINCLSKGYEQYMSKYKSLETSLGIEFDIAQLTTQSDWPRPYTVVGNCNSPEFIRVNQNFLTSLALEVKEASRLTEQSSSNAERRLRSAFNDATIGMGSSLKSELWRSLNPSDFYLSTQSAVPNSKFNLEYTITEIQVRDLERAISRFTNEKYKTNYLSTGSHPYTSCYRASSCYSNCSEIRIKTSSQDVIAIVKNTSGRAVAHAYIRAGSGYSMKVQDGNYKVFFISGEGWNPTIPVPSAPCSNLRGWFVNFRGVTKDNNLSLYSQTVTYELSYQTNGNFTPASSSLEEAL